MKKYNLMAGLMFICCLLTALTIKGQILDEKGHPLREAIIQTEQTLVWSDSLGSFSLYSENPVKEITIRKIGYETLIMKVQKATPVKVILRKKSLVGQQIIVNEKAEDRLVLIKPDQKLGKEDIVGKSVINSEDWLQGNSSINLKGNSLKGEKKTVSLAGHSPRHTIVMLDGVVLNPSGMEIDLSSLPAENIESVEISKNNTSVETGSGGIAGIISIKTQKARQNEFSVSTAIGSYSLYHQALALSLKNQNSSYYSTLSHFQTKNNFQFKNRQSGMNQIREDNNKQAQNFTFSHQRKFNKNLLNMEFSLRKFNNQLPGPYNYSSLYKESYLQGLNGRSMITYDLGNEVNGLVFQGYFFTDISEYKNLKPIMPVYKADSRHNQKIHGVKSVFSQKLKDFNFKEGLEYKNERYSYTDLLNSAQDIDFTIRENYTVFAGMEKATIPDNFIEFNHQLTVRDDYTHQFKHNTSFRIEESINLQTKIPVSFTGNYGTSYMLPSFYDLYWKGDTQTQGNALLKPEKSRGYRVSGKIGDNPVISQAYWKNETKDQIYWDRSLQGWKPFNLSQAELTNFETDFNWEFMKNQHIQINYTRTIALDKSKDADGSPGDFYNKYIIYTPDRVLNATMTLNYKIWNQRVEYKVSGKQWTTRDQLINPLQGFELWNIHESLKKEFKSIETEMIFSLFNLFDKGYEIYAYNPEPGRNWQIQLNIKYKKKGEKK